MMTTSVIEDKTSGMRKFGNLASCELELATENDSASPKVVSSSRNKEN